MAFGCFVDIYQQDGKPVRMHYEGMGVDTLAMVKWIGIMEETAQKFRNCGDAPTREDGERLGNTVRAEATNPFPTSPLQTTRDSNDTN